MTADEIDISSFSGTTRAALVRFAEVLPKYEKDQEARKQGPVTLTNPLTSEEIVCEQKAFGSVILNGEYFAARDALMSCPEEQIRQLTEKFNVDKAFESLKTDDPREGESLYFEIQKEEYILYRLGLRIKDSTTK